MAARFLVAAGAAVLLAGCGPSPDRGEGLTPEQVNALGLGNRVAQRAASRSLIGLDPLSTEDLARMDPRPTCILTIGGQPVLAAGQWNARVRRHGLLTELTVEGPVGGSGGFFQTEAFSLSIGLPRDARQRDPGAPPGAARARLNDRRSGTSTEVRAIWNCGGG